MYRISALGLGLGLALAAAACGFEAPKGGGDDARPTDSGVPPGQWWDPAWSSRLRIVIDNSVELPTGFQLGVPRDLDVAPCNDTRDAVRVVHNHTTELPRVIDELGVGASDEWIWFRLAAPIAAGTGPRPSEYWLYCGNGSPGSPPGDPTAVFDAYDDFAGASLSSSWRAQNLVSVGNGVVTLDSSNAGIHSEATYGAGTATDFVLQATGGALTNGYFWGGFEVQFSLSAPWVVWIARASNQIRQEILRTGTNPTGANARPIETDPHLYGVEHYGTSARFRYHNAPVGSIPYGGTIGTAMNVRLHNYDSDGPIQISMARVRKAVDPIPTVTLETIEPRP